MPALKSIGIVLLTLFIFFLTKNPSTAPFKLHLTLLSIVCLIVFSFFNQKSESDNRSKIFIYLAVTTVLFIIGSTGWFLSPFFFALYLSVIALSFSVSLPVALAFAVTLVAIFAFNIGEVDPTYDFLVVLSLLTTIPLTIYLRKRYLKMQEAQKEILILKQEKQAYKDKVDEVLSNVLTNFAVNLKQPINDIKQMAYRMSKLNKEKEEQYRQRIISASEEALNNLNHFEEEATGHKLLTNSDKL